MKSSAQVLEVVHERARDLIRSDSGTLGYWATWAGNSYWLSSSGEVAIAYRVVRNVAVAIAQPFSSRPAQVADIQEFELFCQSRRWTPAFLALQPGAVGIFENAGWTALPIGEEALVCLEEFDLSTSQLAKVRHTFNRSRREKIEAVWSSWASLSHQHKKDIQALTCPVGDKVGPKRMGFTIGGLREMMDPEVRLMLAANPEGQIIGVTSWLPIYRDNQIVGWTLDYMRRAHDSFSGVTEFLIGKAIQLAQSQGMSALSLSGVPLVEGKNAKARLPGRLVLAVVAKWLDSNYGFRGLYFFKKKFNPQLKPIFLAYPATANLPRVVLAVASAYLPS